MPPLTSMARTQMMVAFWSSSRSNIGLGMRRRVRGSSMSMNPVSRKFWDSSVRHEIAVTGSANDTDICQPLLERMNRAAGAVDEVSARLPGAVPAPGGNIATVFFFNSSARARASRTWGDIGNRFTNSSNTAATVESLMAPHMMSSADSGGGGVPAPAR